MRVRHSVSFEFPTRAPVTHRGEVSGTTSEACMRRAIRRPDEPWKLVSWTSVVCVLLERLDQPAGFDSEVADNGFAPDARRRAAATSP
jgi:hypothetical protein